MPNGESTPRFLQPLADIGGLLQNVLDLITGQFQRMPRPVQVLVYLLFVAYFMLVSLHFFGLLPQVGAPDTVEISGLLTLEDGEPLPAELVSAQLWGDDLYVLQKPITQFDDRFEYRWILRVRPDQIAERRRFQLAFPTSDASGLSAGITVAPSELRHWQAVHGLVRLVLDETYTTIMIDTASSGPGHGGAAAGPIAPPGIVLLTPAFAGQRPTGVSADSARLLIEQYQKVRNPVSQLQIREALVQSGSDAMLILADSLKIAVDRNHPASIVHYASTLGEFESLAMLTSAGSRRDLFDEHFYARTTERMHTGNAFERRQLATFLRKLQDARSLPFIFRVFQHTDTSAAPEPPPLKADPLLTQKLCLYVLESFSTNEDSDIRRQVEDTLRAWQRRVQHGDLPGALGPRIAQTLARFQPGR